MDSTNQQIARSKTINKTMKQRHLLRKKKVKVPIWQEKHLS